MHHIGYLNRYSQLESWVGRSLYRVAQKFCNILRFAYISVQTKEKILNLFLKDAQFNSLQTCIYLNLE